MSDDVPVRIPASIIALLGHNWRPAEPGFSHFEAHFYDDRVRNPNFYIYREDTVIDEIMAFSTPEVVALSKEKMLERFINSDGHVWRINEHAQHAVRDFCEEVYDAWETCQQRLNRIPIR